MIIVALVAWVLGWLCVWLLYEAAYHHAPNRVDNVLMFFWFLTLPVLGGIYMVQDIRDRLRRWTKRRSYR